MRSLNHSLMQLLNLVVLEIPRFEIGSMNSSASPASALPPNAITDHEDPNPAYNSHIAMTAICLTMAVLGVFTRVFTKVFVLKKIRIEDCNYVKLTLGRDGN